MKNEFIVYSLRPKLSTKSCFMKQKCHLQIGVTFGSPSLELPVWAPPVRVPSSLSNPQSENPQSENPKSGYLQSGYPWAQSGYSRVSNKHAGCNNHAGLKNSKN